jgi:class 3 adenylate cyclase
LATVRNHEGDAARGEEPRSAAIVFCDICDFSSIMGKDAARARSIAAMARSCVEQTAGRHGGQIIKHLADGMLVEFSTAASALQSSIDLQKAVAKRNAEVEPYEQFQLRVEVHAGDVVVSDGNVLCNGVNVAEREVPLAAPGEICISRDVLNIIHNRISGG